MQIEIYHHEGHTYPFLLCELCNQRIEVASAAEYLIPDADSGTSNTAIVGHKTCTQKYESSLPLKEQVRLGNMDVEHLLFCLITNTKVDYERAKKNQELMSHLGF